MLALHTTLLEEYMQNESVLLSSVCTDDEILFTYINAFTGSRSKLDNFIISKNISNDIRCYYTIYECDNLWNHILIVVDITLSTVYFNDILERDFFTEIELKIELKMFHKSKGTICFCLYLQESLTDNNSYK